MATLLRNAIGWLRRSPLAPTREAALGAVAAIGVGAAIAWACLRHHGDSRGLFLSYNVPIAAPFVAFVAERAAGRRLAPLAVDASVVLLALLRVVHPVPGYSGHVLFLLYATLTARSVTVRALSLAVLLQVLVIKLVFWGDYVTPVGAAVLAGLAALAHRRLAKTPRAHTAKARHS